MNKNSYPTPPRSACTFCPYHNDTEWRRLKDAEPEDFEAAAKFEDDLQSVHQDSNLLGTPFLHRSLKPLREVDFSTEEERGQANLNFNNECEGMCGV
jgi:hypothetical protein